MGQHTFEWPYPASEVYVTGTFDDWKRTVRLQKDTQSGAFVATINLELDEADKILYKFVVDGNWTVSNAARTERDTSGFENNVLIKEDMSTPVEEETKPLAESDQSGVVEVLTSSVAPDATTVGLASNVPLVKDEANGPSQESPTPALDDVPGGFPETPSTSSILNPVEDQTFSVKPMPATTTIGNPIDLQPGQPIPDLSSQTVDDTVHLDEESYNRADASNFGVREFLPPVVTPPAERALKGTGILDIPGITPHTGENAAEVPDVKKSQENAHVEPEASAVPGAIQVAPEAPATAEGDGYFDATTAAATVSEAISNAAVDASESTNDVISGNSEDRSITVEQNLIESVPEVVRDSQEAPKVPPEATANAEAIDHKADAEYEIVHYPPELHPTITTESYVPVAPRTPAVDAAENVSNLVKESIRQAHVSPEAAANPAEVAFKEAPAARSFEEAVPRTVVATNSAPIAIPSIRKVEPDAYDENLKTTGPKLSTSPISATTHTFTQPVSGTTANGNATKDATSPPVKDSSELSNGHKATDQDTHGIVPISSSSSNGSNVPKKKRRGIISKIKNLFK